MRHDLARIRNAEIVRRVVAGEHMQDLADEYGLHRQYVYVLVRNAGVPKPPKGEPRKALRRRAKMIELHSLGISGGRAAEMLGVSRPTFSKDAKILGLRFSYDTTGKWADVIGASQERANKMAAMYRSGMTLQQIGEKFEVSRERVRQLISKHVGINHKDGGQMKRAEARRAKAEARRNAEYLAKYGCTWEQYKEVRAIGREMVKAGRGVYQTPLRAFFSQRNNAAVRGISWELTFWQWWTIWQESGKWSERGRRGDAFVMCRHRDEGPYAVGNVFIGTLAENSSDQPNNPYRRDHPDHDKVAPLVAANLRKAFERRRLDGVRKPSTRKRDKDLPVGVRRSKTRGQFIAMASIGGKTRYLGTYSTPAEAHNAYLVAVNAKQMEAA